MTGASIVPTRWEILLVERPILVMACSFVGALVITAIAPATGNFPSLSQGGFTYRSGIEQMRADAFTMLGGADGVGDSVMSVFYEASDLLDAANLKRMCEFEAGLFERSDYAQHC